jgi:hypothetical protein
MNDMVMSMSMSRGDEHKGGDGEVLIATIDVRQLHALSWPIMRALAPRFVEASELRHYLEHALSTGHWACVRAIPSRNSEGNKHVFDVFGVSAH